MPTPTWVDGQVLVAADVNSWFVSLGAYKTADLIRTSNALANDPDLQVTVAASSYYIVRANIGYIAASGVGFLWGWSVPTGAGGAYGVSYNKSGVGASNENFTWAAATSTAGTPTSPTQSIILQGYLSTSTSGGTFAFKWASGTNGSNCTCSLGSSMILTKVG